MKELYEQLGISSRVYDFCHEIEESLKERFIQFDKTAEYNQMKVLLAMQKNRVSEECFWFFHQVMVITILAGIHWKRYMQILSIQKQPWYGRRSPVVLMLWQLPCLEIFVREMSF